MTDTKVWLTPDLVLGWKVTKGLEPQHWDTPGAKPGRHKLTDVVTTVPKTIAHHTVIIAQSGSGKSFFLGRLIEEILLKTKSRVLILDQNSDFRKIGQAKDPKYWTSRKKRYDRTTRRGFLADEPKQEDFMSRWRGIDKVLYANKPELETGFKRLRLNWLNFPADLLAEDADQEHRDQLRHCHNFVRLLAELAAKRDNKAWLNDGAFLGEAEALCRRTAADKDAKADHVAKIVDTLRATFGSSDEQADKTVTTYGGQQYVTLPPMPAMQTLDGTGRTPAEMLSLEDLYQQGATYRKFVEDEALRFYFSRAFELADADLINRNIREMLAKPSTARVEVVDLPSIPDGRRQKMAMCTILEAEWQRARREWEIALAVDEKKDKRVPTFIVVEEAHNAVPAVAESLTDKKLQEQFRRIAAEGRKYGLFLILVSQRPDKLDRMVMSECENRAVMKVGSSFILRTTCDILGLETVVPRMTEKVLDFDLGRALLVGPWVGDDPAFMMSAARRTQEGGRDLRSEYWARLGDEEPEEEEEEDDEDD